MWLGQIIRLVIFLMIFGATALIAKEVADAMIKFGWSKTSTLPVMIILSVMTFPAAVGLYNTFNPRAR